MAKLFATSADYLSLAAAVVAAPPFSMHIWAKHTALASAENLMSLGTLGSGDNRFYLHKTSDDATHATERDATSGQSTSSNLPDTNWHAYTGIYTSHSSRELWFDGANRGGNAQVKAPTAPNSLYIGRSQSGSANAFTGKLAYAAVWNRVLTAVEVANLALQSPLVAAPSGLVAYYILRSDALDTAGANNFTVNGAAGYDTDMPAIDAITPACAGISVAGQVPTLLKEKIVAPGVGALALVTNSVTIGGTPLIITPLVGALSIAGLAPTSQVAVGPSGAPDVGLILWQGQVPTLKTVRIITNDINTSDADETGLAPTVIPNWLLTPAPAAISIQGLAPSLALVGARTVSPGVGAVSVAGLAASISVPAGQEGSASPFRGDVDMLGLAPDLVTSLTVTPDPAALTLSDLEPFINTDFNWHDAPSASERSWHN